MEAYYGVDIEAVRRRLTLLWNRECLDRCCVQVTAPKDRAHPYVETFPETQEELRLYYTDADRILARNLERLEKTHFAGEALPIVFPYMGTGGHAKYLAGCRVEYRPGTVWIHPAFEDYDGFDFSYDENNPVLAHEVEVLRALSQAGMGRFLVGQPDNCGSFDALSQLRGPDLMMDFYDQPEKVAAAGEQIVSVLLAAEEKLFAATRENNLGGSVLGWMGTWSQGKHLQLQCDLSVMISPELFREFIVPELTRTSRALDNAIYHFDGIEQIRHLDALLAIDSIDMIQWTQVAGQPPAQDFLPQLQRIQKAGKGIMMFVDKAQIDPLLDGLSPEGLLLSVGDAVDAQEAEDIVSHIKYRF